MVNVYMELCVNLW